MSERYIIGTQYFARPGFHQDWFFKQWWHNTMKYAKPERVIVLSTGNCVIPHAPGQWVNLSGDLGHIGDILSGRKKFDFPASTPGILILALMAYLEECDFIYKEQDMLAFGDYVKMMYEEIGDKQVIWGKCRCMGRTSSLKLIKHAFIPEFVRMFLNEGKENFPENITETRIARMEQKHRDLFTTYSFGYDRDRPFNVTDRAFTVQKITTAEMRELQAAGLIDPGEIPEVSAFTNCVAAAV